MLQDVANEDIEEIRRIEFKDDILFFNTQHDIYGNFLDGSYYTEDYSSQ